MITTTQIWSTDISSAPHGETVSRSTSYLKNGKAHERIDTDFVPAIILALTNCGKVIRSYWIPPRHTTNGNVLDGGRWSGMATGEVPIAWTLWPSSEELIDAIQLEEHG